MDNGLDLFVQNEDPHQIMNLLFEKQVNKVVFGEIFYSNDFEDWLQCVNQGEERRNEQHMEAKRKDVLNIFQLDIESSSHNTNEMKMVLMKERKRGLKSRVKSRLILIWIKTKLANYGNY
jgi:hypothetical protein